MRPLETIRPSEEDLPCDDIVLDVFMDLAAVSGDYEEDMESEAEEFDWLWSDDEGDVEPRDQRYGDEELVGDQHHGELADQDDGEGGPELPAAHPEGRPRERPRRREFSRRYAVRGRRDVLRQPREPTGRERERDGGSLFTPHPAGRWV